MSLGLVGLLLILMVLAYSFSSTTVAGTEFSPHTFQTRTFRYTRIPGTKVRLSATRLSASYSIVSTPVLKHLNPVTTTTRWDVVKVSERSTEEERAPNIAWMLLQTTNANGVNFWDEWSTKNPQLAAVFWPLLQQVLIEEKYFYVPTLLEQASASTDSKVLIEECEKILSQDLLLQ